MAEFEVQYNAIVFKPFKGEVLEGIVSNVNKVRGDGTLPRPG
jgi:DNA-directed RNA polymerase II subunit RPB7